MGLTLADPTRWALVRHERDHHDWSRAIERLRLDAAAAAADGPWFVTAKSAAPPSGDLRDYLTLSEYFWPDPTRPDGLPWILRDGHPNPDATAGSANAKQLRQMSVGSRTLALAGLVLDDDRWTGHAASTLRHWFLGEHGMRPNLRFASLVPGNDDPPGWGLIRAHPFLYAMEAHSICEASAADGARGLEGLDGWFAEFLDWTLGSDMWRAELARGNNHTTWCLALGLGLAIHLEEPALAVELADRVPATILDQIRPDGRQPRELERSRSYFYSCFNLDGLTTLADLAAAAGLDCWSETTVSGDRLRRAARWMAPRMEEPDRWPDPFHIEWDRTVGAAPLHRTVARCPDAVDLAEALYRVPAARRPGLREWLMWDTGRRPPAAEPATDAASGQTPPVAGPVA